MDLAVERAKCAALFKAIGECNLIDPAEVVNSVKYFQVTDKWGAPLLASEKDIFETFFSEYWVDAARQQVNYITGYHVLYFAYKAGSGLPCYSEYGPDPDLLVSALGHVARTTNRVFSPENIKCDVVGETGKQKYWLRFQWRGKPIEIYLPADADYPPEVEFIEALNKVLADGGLKKKFIGVAPKLPFEESTYIFTSEESVRAAIDRGLLWAEV